MSTDFYSFLEALSFYSVWMLSVCSTIDLFRETRGNGPISRWGKVFGGHQHPVYDGSVRLHRINRGVDVCLSQREAGGFSLKSQ